MPSSDAAVCSYAAACGSTAANSLRVEMGLVSISAFRRVQIASPFAIKVASVSGLPEAVTTDVVVDVVAGWAADAVVAGGAAADDADFELPPQPDTAKATVVSASATIPVRDMCEPFVSG